MKLKLTLATLLASSACNTHRGEHTHEEPGHGHGHAHASGDGTVVITHFSDRTELFVEVPALEVGKQAQPAIHLTTLSDFRAVENGRVTFELGDQGFAADAPTSSGIFRPKVTPTRAGSLPLTIRWSNDGIESVHALAPIAVYADGDEKAPEPEPRPGAIGFTKEQQWRMDFALAPARTSTVRPSFQAYGTLRPRSDGEAYVSAPFAGRLDVGAEFPKIGHKVTQGDRLARLVPQLDAQSDPAGLSQAVSRAAIRMRQAERERTRLEGLLSTGAIAERRVIDARFEHERAATELSAARQRLAQSKRVQSTGRQANQGSIEVRAPLAGTLVEVTVVPGSFIKSGAPMFRIVDLAELWLEVHVAEAHAGELEAVEGVWFTVEGFESPFEASEEQVVTVGGVVDQHSRTLPLYLAVDNAERRLRVGMFADVRVITGAPILAVTVPVSSVVREAGLPVVYVQLGGESFERRLVRLGIRDGERVQVLEGIEAKERVVSRGAYAVRLAGATGQAPGHGHAH